MSESVTAASEGSLISLDKQSQVTVLAACGGRAGRWFCVTHGEGFANQFAKDGHIDGGRHELVWVCFEHGPEVP